MQPVTKHDYFENIIKTLREIHSLHTLDWLQVPITKTAVEEHASLSNICIQLDISHHIINISVNLLSYTVCAVHGRSVYYYQTIIPYSLLFRAFFS